MIYFIQKADGTGPIKIGHTRLLPTRLKTLQHWAPYELKVIRTVAGDIQREASIHAQFDHIRIYSEWFESTPDLMEFIAGAVDEPEDEMRLERYTAMENYLREHFSWSEIAKKMNYSSGQAAREAWTSLRNRFQTRAERIEKIGAISYE